MTSSLSSLAPGRNPWFPEVRDYCQGGHDWIHRGFCHNSYPLLKEGWSFILWGQWVGYGWKHYICNGSIDSSLLGQCLCGIDACWGNCIGHWHAKWPKWPIQLRWLDQELRIKFQTKMHIAVENLFGLEKLEIILTRGMFTEKCLHQLDYPFNFLGHHGQMIDGVPWLRLHAPGHLLGLITLWQVDHWSLCETLSSWLGLLM